MEATPPRTGGPACSGMLPATANELGLRHQISTKKPPISFKSLPVRHERTCPPDYTKCSRQQNKNNGVKAEIMWTTSRCGKEREVKQLHTVCVHLRLHRLPIDDKRNTKGKDYAPCKSFYEFMTVRSALSKPQNNLYKHGLFSDPSL